MPNRTGTQGKVISGDSTSAQCDGKQCEVCEINAELLEALKLWKECAEEHANACTCGREARDAAIAKATGRAQG